MTSTDLKIIHGPQWCIWGSFVPAFRTYFVLLIILHYLSLWFYAKGFFNEYINFKREKSKCNENKILFLYTKSCKTNIAVKITPIKSINMLNQKVVVFPPMVKGKKLCLKKCDRKGPWDRQDWIQKLFTTLDDFSRPAFQLCLDYSKLNVLLRK